MQRLFLSETVALRVSCLFAVTPLPVKMRLERSAERDKREIKIIIPLKMPRAKRRAFKIVFSYRTVVTPVDIPEDWDPRAKQQPTGLIAYAAAGASPYGLRLLIFPQPPDGALKNQNAAPTTPPCFCRRQRSSLLLFEPTGHPTKRKKSAVKTADFLVGCPVGLEPTVSRSTIWRVNRLR